MSRRSVCLAVPVACMLFAATASAATRPSVTVVGLPIGKIAGKSMPYTETNTLAELSVTYKASLPHGAKLQLLIKASSISPYKPSKTPVRLVGEHAKVHVTEPGIGGPVLYKVAVVSGRQQLAVSSPATVYWAKPPGGVFVSDESEGAYTSLTVPHENCEAGCKGNAGSGQGGYFRAYSSTSPMPIGWTVSLIFNGTVECTTKDIEGNCGMELAFPTVTATTVIPLVGQVTSPSGKETKATLLVTVYP